MAALSESKRPCDSNEGTTSDPLIVDTPPAPKRRNDKPITAAARCRFKCLKTLFNKSKCEKISAYQKQGNVCEESSSNNQQDQRPGEPEPKANPEKNNDPVSVQLATFHNQLPETF